MLHTGTHALDFSGDGVAVSRKHGARVAALVEITAHRRIAMRADKIQRQSLFRAVGERLIDPPAPCRSGTTHSVGGVNRFQSPHRGFVELEILGAGDWGKLVIALASCRAHPKAGQVWFVPNLEIPSADFLGSIPFGNMPCEGIDESRPFCIVLRRCNIGLVPKDRLLAAREGAGHEAQLHEGLHANGLKEIEELVHILPVVDGITFLVLLIHAHIIAKQSVETDVAEAALGANATKLALPIGPQSFICSTCSYTEIVHPTRRSAGIRTVGINDPWPGSRLTKKANRRQEHKDNRFTHTRKSPSIEPDGDGLKAGMKCASRTGHPA